MMTAFFNKTILLIIHHICISTAYLSKKLLHTKICLNETNLIDVLQGRFCKAFE